jgi:hypothetical protein
VTARKGDLRFCVDESALGSGKALAAARTDTIHIGHRLIPDLPYGTSDEIWIPRVAEMGLDSIGRDKHIRTRPAERLRLHEAGLRVFRIGGKRDLSTWAWLDRIVRAWNRMETIVINRPDGPWFYLVNENGIVEVPLLDGPKPKRPPAERVKLPPPQPKDQFEGLFDRPRSQPRET